jgi:hypothetical protein
MAARQLHSTFTRLASSWPKDPLRPNAQMGRAIQAFADETFLATPASASKLPDPQPPLPDVAAAPERDFKQLSAADEGAARAALEALQAIQEGKASKQVSAGCSSSRPAARQAATGPTKKRDARA